ncbi:MAG TPA: histidine phosphatase family protein [Dongiaceae bacterium]|nr:histidine phosphatase family protein [Dongiaceae bacterium]
MPAVRADEAAAWQALSEGGHVALLRHAAAPGGAGDPPGFRLEDCTTQRNLSAEGRADATAIGARLKERKVVFEKILTSPWCRCVDTAALLDMGPATADAAFSNIVVLSDQREQIVEAGRNLIGNWRGDGNLLVVTHGANISALIGISPSSGEMVVARIGTDGAILPVGRIPPPAS